MSEATKTPFAVIEAGGKQYRITEGTVLSLEKMGGDFTEGDTVTFDKVLLVDDGTTTKVGTPYLEKTAISATFMQEGKGKKLRIVRFRSKSNYHRTLGHRQPFTQVKFGKVA
ncbi:MAG: large subunit ribosomal protein L21 [Planctomycetota bacterium]|jgi:large subunit ribosomal protein L21